MHRLLLMLCCAWWSACALADKPEPVIYLPTGAQAQTTLPVAVWLHGYRGYPGAIAEAEYFQKVANRLSIAIVGLPGTTLLADETLQWTAETVADHAYIQDRLAALQRRIPRLDIRRVALFGFSQGGLVAGNLALAYPERYAGAVIMSPGSPGGMPGPVPPASVTAAHRSQYYVVVCGAQESPGTVYRTGEYARVVATVSPRTESKQYEGMSQHTRPPDFKQKLPDWLGEMLGLAVPPLAAAP